MCSSDLFPSHDRACLLFGCLPVRCVSRYYFLGFGKGKEESFTMITLLFPDFTGTVHSWFGWMAKIQFLPAVLALNVGVMIALVLLTFGLC